MTRFIFVLPVLMSAAVTGCGTDSRGETPQAEEKVVSVAQKSSAVGVFLHDPSIAAELDTKAYAPPEAVILLKGQNLGHEMVEFLVATQYDDTPPGVQDASFSKLVAAKVFFPADGSTPSVERADVRQAGAARPVANPPPSSLGAAIGLFNADAEVTSKLSAGTPSQPEAVLLNRATSIGGNEDDYLVSARVDATPDIASDGQSDLLVAALVHFGADGTASVSFAEIVRSVTSE